MKYLYIESRELFHRVKRYAQIIKKKFPNGDENKRKTQQQSLLKAMTLGDFE